MALSSSVASRDMETKAVLASINVGAKDLAVGLGMEQDSDLHAQAHKRLAAQLQEIAVMDAKMDLKVKATTKAMKALAQEGDRRQASGSAAAAAGGDERMSASVSSSMQGADEKALESKRYKELMKNVTTLQGEDEDDDVIIDRGNAVSLICPITSATFKDPVRSKDCNHTFEKAAIDNHIKIAGNKEAKCPVAGCAKTVRRANLVPDDGMKRLLRIESQTEQTAPAMEAEEIDDTPGETYI
eukprot:jgi/Undpi1/4220/HiC_scaffold_16.g07586.m1